MGREPKLAKSGPSVIAFMWGMLRRVFSHSDSANEDDSAVEELRSDSPNSTQEVQDDIEVITEEEKKTSEQPKDQPGASNSRTVVDEEVKKMKHPVVIRWHHPKHIPPHRVCVCGSWDGWDKHIRLYKSENDFSTVLDLKPGYYEFKFYVDDEWMTNENLPYTDVGYYSKNIITVKEEDFEVVAEEKKET
ncbi:hypothetical protein ANCCEY_01728 [Ancylostoma ceylanicum]|uniref:5'-AMP-activated protein kinase subunit beta-1 n=4 Tax=Ancylostoma ceylanicum TaxID=53326 RepID=A0A0D6M9S2_9BILA|nr:hypothetical protein ANCCEY_01728 [Ancylostoma ceylanicum]EYC34001.1 hypothetical protein Y032_0001g193 [Ancylostoma ceylanicum]